MRRDTTTRPTIGVRRYSKQNIGYLRRNCEILSRLGDVQGVPRARELARQFLIRLVTFRRLKIYDVLILNWAENVLTQWGGRLSLRGIAEYRILLWLCRQVSVRLVYVRHNERPHNTPPNDRDKVQAWIEKGQQQADAVVAHSPVYAETNGMAYVPHPLYDLTPSFAARRNEYLIFGRIERYKNIDRIIAAWSGSATLAVVGPCSEQAYVDELRELADGKPVTFDIGFQDEQEIADRVASSAGVIIANTPESVIVSGTFFFALTCGARVYATATAFYQWIESTPLAGAVRTARTIPELADRIRSDSANAAPTAASIRAAAEELFGDESVLAAWETLIDELSSP